MKSSGKLATAAGALALAVSFIGSWEGLRTLAYPDKLADDLPTVCYGETRGVKLGDKYTKAECDAMLQKSVVQFEAGLDKCLTVTLPVQTKIALVSWTYNVGSEAACKSTLVKKANAGNLVGACDELLRWNKANGRVVQGLTNRREAERALCLQGLISAKAAPVPAVKLPGVVTKKDGCK